MKFTLRFDGGPLPLFVQDGEDKGRIEEIEFETTDDGKLEVSSMTVHEKWVPGRSPGPFAPSYETVTGKKPPEVPAHPRIKVIR